MPRLFAYNWFAVSLQRVLPAVIAGLLCVPVSNTVLANEDQSSEKDNAPVERVGSVDINDERVRFDAISHGCTTSEHFELQVETVENNCRLTIVRTKPDLCRRAPFAVSLSVEWSYEKECGGSDIFIANPVLIISDDGLVKKRLK